MATLGHLLGTLGSALLATVVISCGGPPVGSKVPRPDPTPIAVGAAAAAAALTLANPDLAGQKPSEQDDGRAPPESNEPRETVPGAVLDRVETGEPVTGASEPCTPAAASKGVSLVPGADETRPSTAPRPPCPAEQPAPKRPAPTPAPPGP